MSEFVAHPEVLKWLALLVGGLLLLALATLSTRFTLKQWRDLRAFWRDYRPTFVAETDEPDDPAIVVADALLDKLLKADWRPALVLLLDFVRRGLDLLTQAEATPLAERPPEQEHMTDASA